MRETGFNGEGSVTKWDGSSYIGSWTDNQRKGLGIASFLNGDRYHGNWNENKQDGLGVMYSSSGSDYFGHWNNGEKTGVGFYLSPNERVTFCLKSDGKVKCQRNSVTEWILKSKNSSYLAPNLKKVFQKLPSDLKEHVSVRLQVDGFTNSFLVPTWNYQTFAALLNYSINKLGILDVNEPENAEIIVSSILQQT